MIMPTRSLFGSERYRTDCERMRSPALRSFANGSDASLGSRLSLARLACSSGRLVASVVSREANGAD